MTSPKKSKSTSLLLHVGFSLVFIISPYLTYLGQGLERNLPFGFKVDENSLFVSLPFLRFCIQNIILLGLFYVNLYFLGPYFIGKKRNFLLYILAALASIMAFIYLVYLFHLVIDLKVGMRPMGFYLRIIHTFLYAFMIVALSAGLYFFRNNMLLNQKQQEIENMRLESELEFLHSQINPHFLFNSLNNIYSLAILKSDKTGEAVLKLSDLLRFVLYESSEKYISINKEIKYIENYIDLQRMRLNENININFEVIGERKSQKINPMLLVPFVENAFKHGISYSEPCTISIRIILDSKSILLHVKNQVFPKRELESSKKDGIGIKNVKRRLEILYHDNYDLQIINEFGFFESILKIELNEA